MTELRIGSLCSGYGGLTLAVQATLGGRVAWHSEYEPPTPKNPNPSQAAARLLEHRFPGVPNIGDMTAVDWSSVEPVDVLEGGTPCQDVSHAGARSGMRAGTRSGLWSSMVDAIDVLRPRLVVWENVRGVLSAGADSNVEPCPVCVGDEPGDALRALGRVLGDLSELGYDARWCGLRASDVGAPHNRFRVFVAAYPADLGHERAGATWRGWAGSADSGQPPTDPDRPGSQGRQSARGRELPARGPVADTQGDGRHEGRTGSTGELGGSDVAERGHAPADPDHSGPGQLGWLEPEQRDIDGRGSADTAWGPYEPAIRRWERVNGPAPAPREPGRTGERLSPRFVEWMMGLPAGWVTDVPGISRNDQLKMLGNGVVPQQAAAALQHLLGGL